MLVHKVSPFESVFTRNKSFGPVSPVITNPPSLVCDTQRPLLPLVPMFLFHSTVPAESVLISDMYSGEDMLLTPVRMYPPSEVCCAQNDWSGSIVGNFFVQSVSPDEFVLMRYLSYVPPIPLSVNPQMTYPLSLVCCTEKPRLSKG